MTKIIKANRAMHVHGTVAYRLHIGSGAGGSTAGRMDIDLMELGDGRNTVVVTLACMGGHMMVEIDREQWDRAHRPGLLLSVDDLQALEGLEAVLRAINPTKWSNLFQEAVNRGMVVLHQLVNPQPVRCAELTPEDVSGGPQT